MDSTRATRYTGYYSLLDRPAQTGVEADTFIADFQSKSVNEKDSFDLIGKEFTLQSLLRGDKETV